MASMLRRLATGRVPRARVLATGRSSAKAALRSLVSVDPIVAIDNFSAASFFQTAVLGGEVGSASGFGAVMLLYVRAIPTTQQIIFHNLDSGGTVGWYWQLSANTLRFGGQVATAYTITPSDVGKILIAHAVYTGSGFRVVVNRVQMAVDTAASLTVGTQRTLLGQWNATQVFTAGGVIATMTHRGVSTVAQMQAYADAARLLGDLPQTMAGVTVSHHWSAKLELAKLTDQSTPKQLTDNITGASVDALATVGNGLKVVKIDPAIDGRSSYGAQGFSDANYFTTIAGQGIQGSAGGFTCTVRLRWDAIPTGLQIPLIAGVPGSAAVWFLRTNGAALSVTANTTSAAYTITAGDLGQWVTVQIQFTGSVLRLLVHGVQIGADVASTITPQGSAVFRFSGWTAQPFVSGALQSVCGGNYVATLAELQQQATDIETAGRLVAIPGMNGGTPKTEHLWDLTADVLSSGVDAMPAVVLDRISTHDLSRAGIAVQTDANSILGVGPYGAADSWQTAINGGIQGSNTCHIVIDFFLTKIPTAAEMLIHATNSGTTTGWFAQFANNLFRVVIAGGVAISPNYTVTAADLGKRQRLVINKTSTLLQVALNGVAAFADTTASAFNANANMAMVVGGFFGAQNFSSGYVELVQGSNTASLTPAEMAALAADLTQPPPITAGKTTIRNVFGLDVAAAGGALPSKSIERISGAAVNTLMRQGAQLTLAQQTTRLFSYETSPIEYGADTYTDTDYFSALDVFPGHPGAWWWILPWVLLSQSVTPATRILLGQETSPSGGGFDIRTTGANGSISPVMVDGGGTARLGSAVTLSASDIGKTHLFGVCWDGQKLHTFMRRVEQGTGATLAVPGYTPAAAGSGFFVGRYPLSTGLSAAGVRTLGAGMGGNSVLTLAEYQAACDAFNATDELVRVPGKTDFFNSLKQDVIANGGAMPSALIDRVGGKNVARTGNPALTPIYGRAAGW